MRKHGGMETTHETHTWTVELVAARGDAPRQVLGQRAMRRKRTTEERAQSFLDMLAQALVSGHTKIVSAEAVAPCLHPIRESKCIGTPDAQNLWQCGVCGRKWLR